MPVDRGPGIFVKFIAVVIILLISIAPAKRSISDIRLDQAGRLNDSVNIIQPIALIKRNQSVDSVNKVYAKVIIPTFPNSSFDEIHDSKKPALTEDYRVDS